MSRDRLPYLKEAVHSVLQQDEADYELIISLDPQGKTHDEHIARWATDLASTEGRVRFRRNATCDGLAAHWNALVHAAEGKFIVILGDDDRLLPTFLSGLRRAMSPQTVVAFANHFVIDEHGARQLTLTHAYTKRYHRDELHAGRIPNAEVTAWSNAVPMSAAMIKTSDARRVLFHNHLNTPELPLVIALAAEEAEFVFVPEYLAEYRIHDRSATSGGLFTERLVQVLMDLTAHGEAAAVKATLLGALLPHAVTRAFENRDTDLARRLRRSEYYPSSRISFTSLVQTCCVLLGPAGPHLFRAIKKVARSKA